MVRYNRSMMLRRRFNVNRYKPKRRIVRRRRPYIRRPLMRMYRDRLRSGFAHTTYTWFKVFTNPLLIDEAVATFKEYSCNLNSAKDTTGTFGSSQGYGFDQLMPTPYKRYQVLRGVTYFTYISQNDNPVIVSTHITPDNTVPTTTQQIVTQKGGFKKICMPAGSGRERVMLKKKWSVKQYLPFYDTGDLSALYNAEPTKRLYQFVGLESVSHDGVPTSLQGVGYLTIYIFVRLFDYARFAQSVDS